MLISDVEVLLGLLLLTDSDEEPVDGSDDIPCVGTQVGKCASQSVDCFKQVVRQVCTDVLNAVLDESGGGVDKITEHHLECPVFTPWDAVVFALIDNHRTAVNVNSEYVHIR